MRVLLYNIRYGTGCGRGYHLPLPFTGFFKKTSGNLSRIIDFIAGQDPDIVALIEVDTGSYRSDFSCQAAQIAKTLGYHWQAESKYHRRSFAKKIPILRKQANAILTREKAESSAFHYFNHGVKRLAIETNLAEVAIFTVHLSLQYRHRQNQLEQLHRLTKKTHKNIIIAGDLNTLWGQDELNLFLAATGLQSANTTGAPSHPSPAPHRQLDFILHSPGLKVDNFSIPDIRLSDHTPLVCDFSAISCG